MDTDKLIDNMLDMFRRDLRHFADLDLPTIGTEDMREELLAEELAGLAREYSKYLEDRRRGL